MNKKVSFSFQKQLQRRTILRGAGVAMALPLLGAMRSAHAATSTAAPKRFVAMTLGLGIHGPNLNPTDAGKNYKTSRYLKPIDDLRDKFTIISGSSHPGVKGGHRAEACILTANPVGSSGRGSNSISIDQHLAKHLGGETRFPSMVLSSKGSNSPSYTENGAMIPAEDSPSQLFRQMFVNKSKSQRARDAKLVHEGRSIMDLVQEDAKRLQRELGQTDRQRLDSYFTSVRDLEKRMAVSQEWAGKPKPKIGAKKPVDIANRNDFVGRQRLMSDMIRLALQTDSTRFISYNLGTSGGVLPIQGVKEAYHSLSHHGRDENKLEQLALIEQSIITSWGNFLRDLDKIDEGGESLLDHTAVLLTSNLGNASNHSNKNMPVLLAGGGFNHGQHLAFDQKQNYALPKLFVSLMQNMGMETDQFAGTAGTMQGLM